MHSQLIEFFRFGELDTGMLRAKDLYLVTSGNSPVRRVEIPIDHVEFIDLLDQLRYGKQIDESTRLEALKELSRIVTGVVGELKQPAAPVQIDLVTNAAELSALPFELALDSAGRSAFAASDPPLVLTRRVRRESHGVRQEWWSEPRILFAVASPAGAGAAVPLDDHRKALRDALDPWIQPLRLENFPVVLRSDEKVLTTVEKASLEAIRAVGAQAKADKRPFTHLHILAHGCLIGKGLKARFGLTMHGSDGGMVEVTPEQLYAAIKEFAEDLTVVTLAVCDGGNQANSIAGGASVAHALHSSGIEVVVGSQFPLTFPGSIRFTRTFYRELLCGQDVRDALHRARSDLYQLKDVGHDWASLVGYVQLPEDYVDRLRAVQLRAQLASLRTAQKWSDDLKEHEIRDSNAYEEVAERLQERITNLQQLLKLNGDQAGSGNKEENLGLLGSAEKRLAELYFERAALGDEPERWTREAKEALSRAHARYKESATENLSHHWTGVQYLCLEAVLTGRIARIGHWHAFREAAETDSGRPEKDKRLWAPGSLAELYLLAPITGQEPRLDDARQQLVELVDRTRKHDDVFPIESTERQLKRYVDWWTKENGYFDGARDLKQDALELLSVLRDHAAAQGIKLPM